MKVVIQLTFKIEKHVVIDEIYIERRKSVALTKQRIEAFLFISLALMAVTFLSLSFSACSPSNFITFEDSLYVSGKKVLVIVYVPSRINGRSGSAFSRALSDLVSSDTVLKSNIVVLDTDHVNYRILDSSPSFQSMLTRFNRVYLLVNNEPFETNVGIASKWEPFNNEEIGSFGDDAFGTMVFYGPEILALTRNGYFDDRVGVEWSHDYADMKISLTSIMRHALSSDDSDFKVDALVARPPSKELEIQSSKPEPPPIKSNENPKRKNQLSPKPKSSKGHKEVEQEYAVESSPNGTQICAYSQEQMNDIIVAMRDYKLPAEQVLARGTASIIRSGTVGIIQVDYQTMDMFEYVKFYVKSKQMTYYIFKSLLYPVDDATAKKMEKNARDAERDRLKVGNEHRVVESETGFQALATSRQSFEGLLLALQTDDDDYYGRLIVTGGIHQMEQGSIVYVQKRETINGTRAVFVKTEDGRTGWMLENAVEKVTEK